MFALFNPDSSHGTRGAAGGEPTSPDDGIKFQVKRNKGLWKSLRTKPYYLQPPTSVILSSLDGGERYHCCHPKRCQDLFILILIYS